MTSQNPGISNEILGFMEDFQKEIDSWNPPSELEELHGIRREGVGFGINFLKESGMQELALKAQKSEQEEDVERLLELAGDPVPMQSQMEDDSRMHWKPSTYISGTSPMTGYRPVTYDILYAADCISKRNRSTAKCPPAPPPSTLAFRRSGYSGSEASS